jgi:hypothetical protein
MRRELAGSLAAGLLGGALILLGAGQPWDAAARSPTVPGDPVNPVNPVGTLVSSLGAVVLLGTLVVAVTRTFGRRLAGSVVVLTALATGYVALGAGGTWTAGRAGVLAGAVLGLLGGALTAVRGPRWAAMSERYDAPSAPRPVHESDPWRALDRGDDPTL